MAITKICKTCFLNFSDKALLSTFILYSVIWNNHKALIQYYTEFSMEIGTFILSLIGLIFSLYALFVEEKKFNQKKYKPFCDLHRNISCSKAFSSKEGHVFGFSNTIIGIAFYLIILISSIYFWNDFIFYLSVLSVLFSLFLAYLSYIKMKNFCLVCTAIYIINILLLVFAYLQI